jgi:DNA-binding NarL/FixJ family response regulator
MAQEEFESIRMLIVDDHHVMRSMLRDYAQLAYPNCVILEAADCASTLALCASHRPRVVLMDIELPDGNGIELIPAVRKLAPGAVVIVVSQYDSLSHAEHAGRAGAVAYVVKDRIYKELLPAVAGALGLMSDGRASGNP